ncbi:MAG: nucleoside kinase [Rikenellaceae bacterium]
MINKLNIICAESSREFEVEAGSTLAEVAEMIAPYCSYPIIAGYVNNRLRELTTPLYQSSTVRFVDRTSFAGARVYERTASFIMQKAVEDLFPEHHLRIRHSIGGDSFYCEVDGMEHLTSAQIRSIDRRMRDIIAVDMPIYRHKRPTDAVREIYSQSGYFDKVQLLDSRPRLYSTFYQIGQTYGYFYGSLAPSSGYIDLFDIRPYYNGVLLALPRRDEPSQIGVSPRPEKLFDIFREYQTWVDIMGVPTVGKLNAKVLAGDSSELIKIAEAFHEKKLSTLADAIASDVERGGRMVLISGPSSSGKTTTAKRLGIHLQVMGLTPVLISLDDYFVNREDTPKDASGRYDFEALEAIDIAQFNDHLERLFAGESVAIPRYDFISGRRKWHDHPLTLSPNSILIVEGIHALNPALTPAIGDELKYKIYVSCITSVAMDNLSRISTSDNRLLRRLTRDYVQRGKNGRDTISQWGSVRRGEERHIFPYQEQADVIVNSSLFYEISVIRPFAEPILLEIPNTVPEYDQARRLLRFLDNFTQIDPAEIPPTSVLREFIGGSSFKY